MSKSAAEVSSAKADIAAMEAEIAELERRKQVCGLAGMGVKESLRHSREELGGDGLLKDNRVR